MHKESYEEAKRLLSVIPCLPGARVLDVGSVNINGTFRSLVEGLGFEYTGLDIAPGRNVDIVAENPYKYPITDEEYDVVLSGSTMEHVEAIWDWIPELVRVTKRGGYIIITTHTSWVYHPYPVDCWRIMPDGMRYLLERSGLEVVEITMFNKNDISAMARKNK